MSESDTIQVAVAIIIDEMKRILLVRKKGTFYFMQPGGKIEPGETAQFALTRELMEELSIKVSISDLSHVGDFTGLAANEPDCILHANIFEIKKFSGDIYPSAEIEEICWLSPYEANFKNLAPLTISKIIPRVWLGGGEMVS